MMIFNRLLWLNLLIFLTTLSSSATADSINNRQYTIQINHAAQALQLEMCFKQAPNYLYARSDALKQATSHIYWQGKSGNQIKSNNDGYIDLPKSEKGCLSYQVSISGKIGNRRRSSPNQHPDDIVTEIDSWLWYTSDRKKGISTIISFEHQQDISVSTPWKLISRQKSQTRFKLKFTPASWQGYIAIGKFHVEDLILNQQRFRVALINGTNNYNKNLTLDWIQKMTASVAAIGGDFPIDDIQVLIIFNTGSSGAVPWGQVNRGGGPGVLFIVNPESSRYKLMEDWTAAHEFSHLLLPFTPSDRWFSEGFASYHQNISRARTGLLNEKKTWRKLIEGFERGIKSVKDSDAPVLGSQQQHKLMQTYWGGAVIALKADIALQETTAGRINLSYALNELRNCCLNTGREWTARETFKRLDQLTGTQVFSDLYRQEINRRKFPEYQSLLKDLGIRKRYSGEIYLDDNAKKAHIRKKIING